MSTAVHRITPLPGEGFAWGLGALSGPTRGAHGRRISLPGFSLATAMGMIDWVHGYATYVRTLPHPPHTPCFTDRDIFVIGVAHLTDGGHTLQSHHTDFARFQLQLGIFTLFRHQLCGSAGGSSQLSSPSFGELDVVN